MTITKMMKLTMTMMARLMMAVVKVQFMPMVVTRLLRSLPKSQRWCHEVHRRAISTKVQYTTLKHMQFNNAQWNTMSYTPVSQCQKAEDKVHYSTLVVSSVAVVAVTAVSSYSDVSHIVGECFEVPKYRGTIQWSTHVEGWKTGEGKVFWESVPHVPSKSWAIAP